MTSLRFVCAAGWMFAAVLPAQDWWPSFPSPIPSSGLVFDQARGRTVLINSGWTSLFDPGEFTWEYDGERWERRVTATEPPPGNYRAAYDASRQRVVIVWQEYGLPYTWEYDGVDWRHVASATSLPPRNATALAFDATSQRVVLFGGYGLGGPSNELWEFDGADWQLRNAANPPPARSWAAMACDPLRQCLVVFGGRGAANVVLTDTWELHGSTWSQVATTARPTSGMQLVWHAGRQRVVSTRGQEVWEYDGGDWVVVPTPGLNGIADGFCYDSARDQLVLRLRYQSQSAGRTFLWDGAAWAPALHMPPESSFGASTLLATDHANERLWLHVGAETWSRDASGWSRVATLPLPVRSAALVHDSGRDRLVLFSDGSWPTGRETRELVGSSWQLVPTTGPSLGANYAMAFDRSRRRLVMFACSAGSIYGPPASYTWEYDGIDWVQAFPLASPPARRDHALVYDAARDRIVLFGGNDWSATPLPDTWVYDGLTWEQAFTPNAPIHGSGHGMAFDPWRGVVVLHGGTGDPVNGPWYSSETWEFDGSDWSQVTPAHAGPEVARCVLAYDPGSGETVLAGGEFHTGSSGGNARLRPVWFYAPAERAIGTSYGAGCQGSGGVPTLAAGAAPALGSTVPLQLTALPFSSGACWITFGFGISRWQGRPLPVDLATMGLPGCDLWIEAEAALGQLVLHSGGTVTIGLPLPLSPVFAGARLAAQALVIDPAVSRGAAVTNAVLMTLR